MNTFSDLPLSIALQGNLTKLGFVTPTPVQAQAIPAQLAGNDVVITAQTGTGKTFAFLLPLLERIGKLNEGKAAGVSALILSPTRELAIQINQAFLSLASGTGIRAAVVVGGLNEGMQLNAIRRGVHVIIATPGRLNDFLDRKLVKLGTAHTVILDEADRMLDMGFLPTIKRILGSLPAEHQTVFCSATIESSVAHLIAAHLKNPVRIAIGSTTKPAEHIDLHIYEVEQDRKLGLLEKMLQEERGSFLVFARTKHGADRLAKKLVRSGSKAAAIHGDRTQSQRNLALRGFQEGSYRVLVATDVAARGVHVEGIAHVVNYDLPQVPEDFIHRVGRTGRAGQRGTASTFSTQGERGEIRKIERLLDMRLTRRPLPVGIEREARTVEAPAHRTPAETHSHHSRHASFKGSSHAGSSHAGSSHAGSSHAGSSHTGSSHTGSGLSTPKNFTPKSSTPQGFKTKSFTTKSFAPKGKASGRGKRF